jgi:hypothetical protein
MNNNPYLIVYGGDLILGDIKFLNLNQKNLGWATLPGISLSGPKQFILGSLVKQLSSTNCDMMFIDYLGWLNVCTGNFTWTTTALASKLPGPSKRFVPVGVNAFPTCFN